MTDPVTLLVNGLQFSGWKSITIQKAIEAVAHGFTLSLTDKWKIEDKPWEIHEGDSCTVKIGDDTAISGYIDDVEPEYTKDEHALMVTGRSKAGDLVDCSVEHESGYQNETIGWNFAKQPLENIVQAILYPFGLKVIKKCNTGDVFSGGGPSQAGFAFEPGEKAFEAIDRLCHMRGVLPISDEQGNVLLVQAGSEHVDCDILLGAQAAGSATAEYIRGNFSQKDRHSQYVVRGQRPATDTFFAADCAHIKASSKDPGVSRYRPLSIIADDIIYKKTAQLRADWEACVRVGRAGSITVGLTGWRMPNHELWPINKMVDVYAPPFQLNYDPLLICGVTFTRNIDAGTVTELTLRRQAAYAPESWVTNQKKIDPWAAVRAAVR